MENELNQVTEAMIGCAYTVANTLGHGFLEKVYENALCHELTKQGLAVQQQMPVAVHYNEVIVGEYVADILVQDAVLVEVKALNAINQTHIAQCLNYLKATGYKICLLINFGQPRVEIKRVVFG